MSRGVALYLVGSAALLVLAGCGKGWHGTEEREVWRRQAEVECLKSGSVKPGAAVVVVKAIEGPGVCGADYPLKVAALGESRALGFADDIRPPAGLAQFTPAPMSPRAYSGQESAIASSAPAAQQGGEEAEEEPNEDTEAPGGPLVDPYAVPGARPPVVSGSRQPAHSGAMRDIPARQETPSAQPPPLAPASAPIPTAAAVAPTATLACPIVSALDGWLAETVQPAALRWFGQPVVEIRQISAYSCRGMNGQRGAPISEHAFGNALDVAAFTFADGRRVTVKAGWHGAPEEQAFLRDVHAGACRQFSTVLAPGSNRYHYDHIHVDLARRRSGRSICNPRAIPGDLIARRARGEPLTTGSLGNLRRLDRPGESVSGRGEANLPLAVPGSD